MVTVGTVEPYKQSHTHRRPLTHFQSVKQVWILGSLFQHTQQIGGLHPLQLHSPVHIDLMVKAHIDQAGAVPPILTCILT